MSDVFLAAEGCESLTAVVPDSVWPHLPELIIQHQEDTKGEVKMKEFKMKRVVITVMMIALAVSSTAAIAEWTWDGTENPLHGWPIAPEAWTYDYNGLGYTRQLTTTEGALLRFDGLPGELVRANGWFIETRVKVTLPTNTDSADAIITLGDEVGGGYVIFSTRNIPCYGPGSGYGFDVPLVGDDWNVIRRTMPAGGTAIQVDVNGTPVGSFTTAYDGWYNSIVTIGDWGSGGGSDVAWDYLSFNEEQVIPEPGSLLVFASGLCGLASFMVRRRK